MTSLKLTFIRHLCQTDTFSGPKVVVVNRFNCIIISNFSKNFFKDPLGKGQPYIPKQRIIHFDLKGAPPKLEFLLRTLKWIKDVGATGVLLEYEDMFPFSGKLHGISASNSYSKSDIIILIKNCQHMGLEVIPLVQTFGHMEFILKHKQFMHLRDHPPMPDSICSCHEETMSLITEYIDQVCLSHCY
jgi:hexosaminidase